MSSRFTGRRLIALSSATVLLAVGLALPSSAQETGTGRTVSGSLTAPTGGPARDVRVVLEPTTSGNGCPHASYAATTGTDGSYTVAGVPAGEYVVRFESHAHDRDFPIPQYRTRTHSRAQAAKVVVGEQDVALGSDQLLPGGRITGMVRDPAGRPAAGMLVTPVMHSGEFSYYPEHPVVTAEDGTFTTRGMRPGKYILFAQQVPHGPDATAGPHAPSYYVSGAEGAATADRATLVTVAEGESAADVVHTVPAAGSLGGRVVTSTGTEQAPTGALRAPDGGGAGPAVTAVEGVEVHAIAHSEGASFAFGVSATTGPDGTYSFPALAPGSYALVFYDWQHERYANARLREHLPVVAGEATTASEQLMSAGGAVSGRVTGPDGAPAEGANVSAHGPNGWGSAQTDADGEYLIDRLGAGEYRLWLSGVVSGKDVRAHRDQPFQVEEGRTTSGIHAQLPAPSEPSEGGCTPVDASDPSPSSSPSTAAPSSDPSPFYSPAPEASRSAGGSTGASPAPASSATATAPASSPAATTAPSSAPPSSAPPAASDAPSTDSGTPAASTPAPAQEVQRAVAEALQALPSSSSEQLRNAASNALDAAARAVTDVATTAEQRTAAVTAVGAAVVAAAADTRLDDAGRTAAATTAAELASALAGLPASVTTALESGLATGLADAAATGALGDSDVQRAVVQSLNDAVAALVGAGREASLTSGIVERLVRVVAQAVHSDAAAGAVEGVTSTLRVGVEGTLELVLGSLEAGTQVVVLLNVVEAAPPAALRRGAHGLAMAASPPPARRTLAVTATVGADGRAVLSAPASFFGGGAEATKAALRQTLVTVAGQAAGGAPAVFAKPAASAAGVAPTLGLSPAVARYGQPVTASGVAAPGSTIQVHARAAGGTLRLVRHATVDESGTWSFVLRPDRNTRILVRSVQDGQQVEGPSAVAVVQAGVSTTVQRVGAATYRFAGRVAPARPGTLVSVTGVTRDGHPVVVGSVRTGSDGAWSLVRRFLVREALEVVSRTRADAVAGAGSSPVRGFLIR